MIAVDLAFFTPASVDPAALLVVLRRVLARRVDAGDAAGSAAAASAGLAALRQVGRGDLLGRWIEELEAQVAALPAELALAIADALAQALLTPGLLASLPGGARRAAAAAMIRAAAEGRLAEVRAWLGRGVEVDARHLGWPGLPTALHAASFHGHAAIVELLLARGADPRATNVQGRTALHVAADGDRALVAALLGEAGAPLEARDFCGLTPRQVAASRGHRTSERVLAGLAREAPRGG